MNLCICYHQLTRPRTVCIFVLCLSARPFWGLFRKADSPPINFTSAFWCGWHLPIGLFFITRFIPTPCIFSCAGFSVMSNLYSLLRVILRPWGFFGCLVSPAFLLSVPELLENFPYRSRARWIVCPNKTQTNAYLFQKCKVLQPQYPQQKSTIHLVIFW